MKLRFTDHAQYRVRERGISIEDIKLVIKQPDAIGLAFGNKMVAKKKLARYEIEVVYVEEKSDFVIITVYTI